MNSKIEKWLSKDFFPQRVLLSGNGNLISTAIEIAAKIQKSSVSSIESGICADTLIFRDEGISFKMGDKNNPPKESVRGLIKWISQKPIMPYRIIVLENFERLSREAPHAILKILEEPPPQAIFLFTTQNHHRIMATILSRMTVVREPSFFEDFEISDEIKMFFQGKNLIWKFKKIEKLIEKSKKEKDRSLIHTFVNDLIIHARFFESYQKHLELLLETQKNLSGNINAKLCLEKIALKMTK